MSLETPNYDTPEIQQKFESEGYNWEEIKATLETVATREEVDTELVKLEGNTEGYYNYLKGLIDTQTEEPTSNTLDNLADSALRSATQAVEGGIDSTLEGAESWGKSQVEEKLGGLSKIPVIGEWLSGFIFDTLKTSYENNKEGIMMSILSYLGFESILNKYSELRNNILPIDKDDPEENVEVPIEDDTTEEEGEGDEEISENSEILSKRAAASDAGYRIMIQVSGIDYGEKNSTAGIYEALSDKSISELRGSLGGNIPTIDRYDDEGIKLSLIGLSGPIVNSLLNDRIGTGEINKILGYNNGGYNELAHVYFSDEELNIIKEKSGDHESLPIGITSRLLALSYRQTIAGISQMAHETKNQVGIAFTNAMFSEEVFTSLNSLFNADSVENDIYPSGMARVLSNNLGVDDRRATVEEIIGNDSINDNEREHLENYISFRDNIFPYIQENFGLGLEDFSSMIDESVGNGEMIGLYLALRGKDTSEISESDKVILHAWVYNILPGSGQGAYTAKMMREIAEGFSEGETNLVMTAVLFRISQYDREIALNSVERTLSGADQAVMDQVQEMLPEAFAGNSRLLRIATWAVEIGGFTLFMKILFKMPVMRAVLIATSGIAGASIYFGLKEGIYSSLNNDIKNIYNDYISLLLENGALGDQTRESLISGINDNSISYTQVVGWLSSTDFSEIASEALS